MKTSYCCRSTYHHKYWLALSKKKVFGGMVCDACGDFCAAYCSKEDHEKYMKEIREQINRNW